MATFVSDSFTGTNGTTLASHTGEVGATWSLHSVSGITAALDGTGWIQGSTSGTAWYTASGLAATNEYDVEAVASFTPAQTSFYLGLRNDATTNDGYLIGWTREGRYEVYRNLTQLASTNATLANGAHTWKATIRNVGGSAVLNLYMDESLVYTYTDSSPTTTVGVAAFFWYSGDGSARLDSFTAADTAQSAALTVGGLTATASPSAISVATTTPLVGGSGSGYEYRIYRGTTPNFAVGSGSLLTTASGLPYADATAAAGTDYYYRLVGADDGNNTVNAEPAGLNGVPTDTPLAVSARLLTAPVAIVFIGDSITYGALSTPGVGPCGEASTTVAARNGPRAVAYSNCGISGSTAADWSPVGANYGPALSATPSDNSAAYQLTQANPGCRLVVSIALGANDSASGTDPATYKSRIQAIADRVHTDWTDALIVLNAPIWYSGNSRTLLTYYETTLARLTQYAAQLAALADDSHIFLGDTSGYAHFAQHYRTEVAPQTGSAGTYFLHPNTTGDISLGRLWGAAIASALTSESRSPSPVGGLRRTIHLSRSR